MDPTPENAPCWQDRYRPQRDMVSRWCCNIRQNTLDHACNTNQLYKTKNKLRQQRQCKRLEHDKHDTLRIIHVHPPPALP